MPSILLYIDILLYEHDAIRVHLKLAIKQITSDQTEADDGIAGKESQAVSFTRPGLETVISAKIVWNTTSLSKRRSCRC